MTQIPDIAERPANPYKPTGRVDETEEAAPATSRWFWISIALFGVGLFATGMIWMEVIKRSPRNVDLISVVSAELLIAAGFGVVLITTTYRFALRFHRLSITWPNHKKVSIGWNLVPALGMLFAGLTWGGLSAIGIYTFTESVQGWNVRRGAPLIELVVEMLILLTICLASIGCMAAALRWLQTNYRRAFFLSILCFFGPPLVFLLLVSVFTRLIQPFVV